MTQRLDQSALVFGRKIFAVNLKVAHAQRGHAMRIIRSNAKHIPNFQKFTLADALAGVLLPPYIPIGPAER